MELAESQDRDRSSAALGSTCIPEWGVPRVRTPHRTQEGSGKGRAHCTGAFERDKRGDGSCWPLEKNVSA